MSTPLSQYELLQLQLYLQTGQKPFPTAPKDKPKPLSQLELLKIQQDIITAKAEKEQEVLRLKSEDVLLPEETVILTVERAVEVGEIQPVHAEKIFGAPKGAEVTKVLKGPEAYEVEFITPTEPEPTWKATTITGQIYAQTRPKLERYSRGMGAQEITFRPEVKGFMEPITQTVSEFGAGIFAIPESWLRPGIPTPIGEVIGRVTGRPTVYETGEVSPFFLAGGTLGTIFESALFTVGFGYAWAGAKRIAPEFIKRPFGKVAWKITKVVKFSRVAKVVHKAKLKLLKYKLWPSPPGVGRVEIAMAGKEAFSLTREPYAKMAFEMTVAPRTGGVWLTNVGLAPAKEKVYKHLISRGGLISIGYLREIEPFEPIWQRGLLPYVTQQQVTRAGILPYVPRVVSTAGKKAGALVSTALGLTVPVALKPAPSRVKPVPRLDLLTLPRVIPGLTERPGKRERVTPTLLPKITPIMAVELIQDPKIAPGISTAQFQEPRIATDLAQIQATKTVLAPTLKMPPILKAPSYVPPFRFPEFREPRASDLDKMFLVKWFKKEHKVADPSVVLRKVMGDRSRTRTYKKKRQTTKRRLKTWPSIKQGLL